MGMIISLLITLWVGYLITRKYKPQPVLFMAGLLLMWLAGGLGYGRILAPALATGSIFFDAFTCVGNLFSSCVANLGLNIMAVGAFAKYMDKIGASRALVKIAVRPLQKFHSPYLVLSLTWIVGMCLGLCINSATGLAMLLMVTMFPVLVGLGVSRLAATAAVATTLCYDWSPSDVGTILSAKTAGLDYVLYWAHYQVPIVLMNFLVVGVLHYFTQKYMDKYAGHVVEAQEVNRAESSEVEAPSWYALLTVVPVALILIFSSFGIQGIKVNIITAMLIGLTLGVLSEMVRLRKPMEVVVGIQTFFDGMGLQMANVVTLVVAAQTFAQGLVTMGTVDTVIEGARSLGFGPMGMMLVMVGIIAACSIIMGSGNAPFFAFAALTPAVAVASGVHPVLMLLPMHFAASIARSCSPITAVIVVSASMGEVSPFDLVKRTVIPMAGAMVCNVGMAYFYYYVGW